MTATIKNMRRALSSCLAVAALLLCGLPASPARADFGIVPGSFESSVTTSQAGGHPDFTTSFALNTKVDSLFGVAISDGYLKNVKVQLPPGLIGNSVDTPRCPDSYLQSYLCPSNTQVGIAKVPTLSFGTPQFVESPIFNLIPRPGRPATLGLMFFTGDVRIQVGVTAPEYGVTATVSNTSQVVDPTGSTITLWGVPADPSHDPDRYAPGPALHTYVPGPTSTDSPRVPFMINPTSCGGPLSVSMGASSWADPEMFDSADVALPAITGCDRVHFDPTMSVQPAESRAMAPSGFSVALKVPQNDDPDGLGVSSLKSATVTLPAGVTLSTPVADGLSSCTDAEFAVASSELPTCPESSAIGEAVLSTPLLPDLMHGKIYVGSQLPNDPYRVFLALEGDGVNVKVQGSVHADPATGQLTASFRENPQLPFETLDLTFKGGSRAPLRTPQTCGTYTTNYELTAWSGQVVNGKSSFVVDQNCETVSRFTPSLEAGTANPVGGAYSPFTLRLTDPDGQANVASLEATLPEGLLAKLAGVPLCSDAQAATGDCPAASQVGTATVGAGVGSNPIYVPQPGKAPTGVYLAGPYKGGPYSLVVKVPAQAGPFDLGTVAVRNALYVDQVTSKVTAKSDPLPQILMGIPISYRDIRVEVNRPEFTVNPTSCEAMQVVSTITGVAGQSANPSSRFQVGNCEALAFEPKLALNLKGAVGRTGHPALKAVLTMPPGADISRAQVGLPHSLFLDQGNLSNVCKQADLKAGTCPPSSIYGKAKAWSPLLDRPLEGPVYLGVGFGHKLPDLVADLNGQIRILLNGKVDTTKQKGLRNTFEAVPDAPVSRFVLELKGGKKYGLIENSENLCAKAQKASVAFTAHSGKSLHLTPTIGRGCGKPQQGKKGAGS